MRAVIKTLPAGCRMEPGDLIGSFKEMGFLLESEACPIRIIPPWFSLAHEDGSLSYIQLKDVGSPVTGSPSGNLGSGNW